VRSVWAFAAIAALLLADADRVRAALPPYYERTRELSAVLSDPDVMQKLGGHEIRGIEAVEPGTYRVWSEVCSLDVKLVDKAQPGPPIAGPWQFEMKVGESRCKR
jgi:hypothetical protein